jgi:hypothetical protein
MPASAMPLMMWRWNKSKMTSTGMMVMIVSRSSLPSANGR